MVGKQKICVYKCVYRFCLPAKHRISTIYNIVNEVNDKFIINR